jgi:predicted ATP-grasp superfamily ATP-dependent carboligase
VFIKIPQLKARISYEIPEQTHLEVYSQQFLRRSFVWVDDVILTESAIAELARVIVQIFNEMNEPEVILLA